MMDRALKERIIGAIVLVLFVVLVVPVFLDGPSNDGEMVTEHVPLPGQRGEDTQVVVLDRDRTDPVPVASTAAAPVENRAEEKPVAAPPQRDPAPEVTADKPESTPAPAPEPEVAVSSTTGMWAVQVGSFGNRENAEQLAAKLRQQGFAAFLSKLATGTGELHRVRIGPQKDRESAEAMAARLQKAGSQGQVVPHP